MTKGKGCVERNADICLQPLQQPGGQVTQKTKFKFFLSLKGPEGLLKKALKLPSNMMTWRVCDCQLLILMQFYYALKNQWSFEAGIQNIYSLRPVS